MDKDIRKEAMKQYVHYFRIWFIAIAVLAVVCLVGMLMHLQKSNSRSNNAAPAERVYDYADVLSDEQEQRLREHIAKRESEYQIDLILVTINEEIESQGYWDTVMMEKADDFYDENNYGYNRVHGDGALLLDNWYEDEDGSQKGSWLSTCGKVEDYFGDSEINYVLDAVYDSVEDNPYEAYKAYVDVTCKYVKENGSNFKIPIIWILVIPCVVALFYAIIHSSQKAAPETVTASTYVAGGKPEIKEHADDFIRKSVVTRRIETSSSSGGRSGGGGHHVSRGGVSHGGGGRRR